MGGANMSIKIGIDPKLLSVGDFERIGTIKKAADLVYEYVNWVTEDHNRTLVHKNHEKRIQDLIEAVGDVFGNPYGRDQLMGFFIANVVKSAVTYEESRTNVKGWHVLKPSVIAEMFVFDNVVGCDSIFVETVHWDALLEEAEETDTSNEVVGRVLVENSFMVLSSEDVQDALEQIAQSNKEII